MSLKYTIILSLLLSTLSKMTDFLKEKLDNNIILNNNIFEYALPRDVPLPEFKGASLNIKCFYVENKNVYSFIRLKNSNDYVANVNTGKLYYNFCKDVSTKCNGNDSKSTLIHIDEESQNCTELSGNIDGDKDKNLWDEFNDEVQEGDKKVIYSGVALRLAKGEKCITDEKKNYSIIYKIYCNTTMKSGDIYLNFSDFDIKECEQVFIGRSLNACKTNDILRFMAFINQYKILFGILIIIIGIFFTLFGNKFIKITLVILCGIALSIFICMIVFSVFVIDSERDFWLCLVIPFVVGLIIGVVLLKVVKVAFFVVGACAGYSIGILIFNLVTKYIEWNPDILYWIVIVLSMIVCGILGLLFYRVMLIVFTAILGGYAIIKGFSLFIGGFPNEQEVIELLKNKEYDQLKKMLTFHVYIYLTFWALIALGGIFYQCKYQRNILSNDIEDKENEEKLRENENN